MAATQNTKIVFLGAGASAPFGFPLTKHILPWMLESIADGSLFQSDANALTDINDLLNLIMPGLSDWLQTHQPPRDNADDLPLITDILSLVDHLLLHATAASASINPDQLLKVRRLLERAIFEALTPSYNVDTLDLPEPLQKQQRMAQELGLSLRGSTVVPPVLVKLVDWIEQEARTSKVVIMSTNYDIAVETELYKRIGYGNIWNEVDFGVEVRDPVDGNIIRSPRDARYGVYKLHGSLNWLRCDLCEHVYVNPAGAIAYLAFSENPGDAGLCHCGFTPLRHLMVAPSIVRDVRDPNLLQVWRNSVEALRVADEWVIIGYSLPPEDIAIRSLFLRGLTARLRRPRPKITVVQRGDAAKLQYNLFFDRSDRVEYFPNEIKGFLESLGFVI